MAQRIRDIDIRCELKDSELRHLVEDPKTRIIEELGILYGAHRIDIAAVNGALHGFEIKSEADDLSRLPDQASAYNQVFDHLTLVVFETHLSAAKSLPGIEHWRILVVYRTNTTARIALSLERSEATNPWIDAEAVAKLLWREEALQILTEIGADRGVRSKPRHVIAQRLACSIPLHELQNRVRETLKHREGWRAG